MKRASRADERFLQLAIIEAKKGMGRTSPNPLVGAIIVKDDKVVAKGYHQQAGLPHAEINALATAGELAKGATIYVTLEPCNHTGKTPPCTKAIIKAGITRVVVGMVDPNPLVAGSGCRYLEEQGLEVAGELLVDQCRAINRPFIKHITTGLPWVIMKAGCSIDGKLAVADGRCAWITGSESRLQVQVIRNRVDAILVGIGTALNDDPSLTTRLTEGRGQDPTRIILDKELRLPVTAKIVNQESNNDTWLFCGPDVDDKKVKALTARGCKVWATALGPDGFLSLPAMLKILGDNNKNSLLVEGGSKVHTSFLKAGLVDQVNLFMAPVFMGQESIPVLGNLGLTDVQEAQRFTIDSVKRLGSDIMIDGRMICSQD